MPATRHLPSSRFLPPLVAGFALLQLLAPGSSGRAEVPVVRQALTGVVVQVGDGDTVTLDAGSDGPVQGRVRVRLEAIDAPELSQPHGRESRRQLANRVQGRRVVVEWHEKDRYGRYVGRLLVDGVDVGLEQVSKGYAWHFAEFADRQSPRDAERYAEAHRQAKRMRVGLWSVAGEPTPPWVWRRSHPRG